MDIPTEERNSDVDQNIGLGDFFQCGSLRDEEQVRSGQVNAGNRQDLT